MVNITDCANSEGYDLYFWMMLVSWFLSCCSDSLLERVDVFAVASQSLSRSACLWTREPRKADVHWSPDAGIACIPAVDCAHSQRDRVWLLRPQTATVDSMAVPLPEAVLTAIDGPSTHFLQVEAALALGATPRQASLVQLRRSLGTGMSPVIDNAKTIGLVSLPGAMTGLIMGGASPLEAVQLQIVVMYMLIGAATFSGLTATYLSQPKFFTPAYQLKQSAISNAPPVAKK